MQSLQLEQDVHLVRDLPFTQYVRRVSGVADFMTYWHAVKGWWVAAVWTDKNRRIVRELMPLGSDPGAWTRQTVQELLNMMLKTTGLRDVLRALRSLERVKIDRIDELQHEHNAYKKYFRQHGDESPAMKAGTLTE